MALLSALFLLNNSLCQQNIIYKTKETPELAYARTGVSFVKGVFYSPNVII